MKMGKYLKSLATTDIDIYSEFSLQYSHMPYDEAQQYREYLLSLSISDIEDLFNEIKKNNTSFNDIDLDNNKDKFIAFLKQLRRPEDDINDWLKNKETKKEITQKRTATLKINNSDPEKLKDFYSKLSGKYIEEGYAKSVYSVFNGKTTKLPENKLIIWLKPNYLLKHLIESIRDAQLFEEKFTQAHWDILPNIFIGPRVITKKNIQGARGDLKEDDIAAIEAAVKKLL